MCEQEMQAAYLKSNSRLLWQKRHSTRRKLFHHQNRHKSEEETNKVLQLEHSSVWCWNLDTSGSTSEIPWKCWNVVLLKDGDQLGRSGEKEKRTSQSQEGKEILHTLKRRMANWIGHILSSNCLVKHVNEGKTKGREDELLNLKG